MATGGDDGLAAAQDLPAFLAAIEGRAYRMAWFATHDREDALELVQEAMMGLVQNYATRSPEEWRPLFLTILQSRIRDWHRRQSVRNRFRDWLSPFLGEDEEDAFARVAADPSWEPERRLEDDQFSARLDAALAALPLRQQQAFLLRAWEGLDSAGTAAAMGCSLSSVKTHYARALARLRSELEDLR
ncbi:MAG: RNA polymerase sigma factor [Rhodocyclaceae bacterium]|nr:RNA polymerase sigma factor [Rhodocyclaceae bacterium]